MAGDGYGIGAGDGYGNGNDNHYGSGDGRGSGDMFDQGMAGSGTGAGTHQLRDLTRGGHASLDAVRAMDVAAIVGVELDLFEKEDPRGNGAQTS